MKTSSALSGCRSTGGSMARRWSPSWRATTGIPLALVVCSWTAWTAWAGGKPKERSEDIWPTAVVAHYSLRYNGIDVGHLDMTSKVAGTTYAMAGSGKVSVLFGAIVWTGSSSVTGGVQDGEPMPLKYAFEWRNNKKGGSVDIGFKDRVATEVVVTPPPHDGPDYVALTAAHKTGALDPVSALMLLTKADGRPPCERRLPIFDGKQRYDIAFSHKRLIRLPSHSNGQPTGGASAIGYVCRAIYEPIAGHRANAATASYAAKRDIEVVLRRIPGSEMLIPVSVTIPTLWGTGSMVMKSIDITTEATGRVALTE